MIDNGSLKNSICEQDTARFGDLLRALTRKVLVLIGTVFLITGIVGIFVPILPTTPFLLIAAACYAAGSKRMYDLLLSNRYLGSYIKNYREGRGIPLKVKLVTIFLLWITIGYSAWFIMPGLAGKLALAGIAVAVTIHIASKPTYV